MDSKCTIEVGVYCYGPLGIRSCSFPHLLHLSSSQLPTNMRPVPPRMILTRYRQYRQNTCGRRVKRSAVRGRGEGQPRCPSTPPPLPPVLPLLGCPPLVASPWLTHPPMDRDSLFSWTPRVDVLSQLGSCSLTFSSVFIWALSLAAKTLIAGTVPNPSVPCSPAPSTVPAHDRNKMSFCWMSDYTLPHQWWWCISGYFILFYSQYYKTSCGLCYP